MRRRHLLAAVAFLVCVFTLWWSSGADDETASAVPAPKTVATGRAVVTQHVKPSDKSRDQRRERAQRRLDRYRAATQYPPSCQPLSERVELVNLHEVQPQRLPVGKHGAFVVLTQSHAYVASNDRLQLGIQCSDACEVIASEPAKFAPRSAEVWRADVVAQVVTAPVRAKVVIDGDERVVAFGVHITGPPPATFGRIVREALHDGSLDLFLEMDVSVSGRYIIYARVDDTDGEPVALLTFNNELKAGRQHARLSLFGKLAHDAGAETPFTVRDIEGYRVAHDAPAGRQQLNDLPGVAHVTRRYAIDDFSPNAWASEQKSRHITRYQSAVNQL